MEIKTNRMKRLMFLIFFAILIWWIFDNIKFVGKGFNLFLGIIAPFIVGLVIAFILNKPMSFIEEKLFYKGKVFGGLKEKYKRPISFLLTLILFIVTIAVVLALVIPNLIGAGEELADKLPRYWKNMQEYIEKSSIKYSKINDLIQDIDFDEINKNIYSFVKGGLLNWLGSTFSVFSSVVGVMVSSALGFVFAVYFLLQKETLIQGLKKLIYAIFPLKVARKICYIGTVTRNSFSQFLTGQTLDALILGGLFFVAMMIFRFPYALMVSIIIAISAFIPIVGSFVGLFIGAFLIFVESPKMAGFFIILFFTLQQIEGNLIYPKIVGKASGLSSVWILAAVTLGGSLMGIVGIILFVPLFSVIQKLLSEYVDEKLKEKEIEIID
ncbi:AI-2E family transporter [Tissierella creatinophila]|uniref:Pheromone autoinducer 2 transporter n=1 Tax=Tissierella creatinophila DSM 6911 TaxID=1123403 RepID=A0A1U7M5Q7_TISCR|nr:AI-2E family transporter [Tissierella creatinophila]OLS02652.1 pheromone autoinducer 2 transporter [Tissierella creatinophila DSM 6911]